MARNATELFTDGWGAYEKVLKHNYMFHEEIYSDIKNYINRQKLNHSVSILEAGCGDASQTIKLFKDFHIQYYHGIDLSSFALEIAKNNLKYLNGKINLKCIDILDGISEVSSHFDIIFTSFAIHHLSREKKQYFFNLTREKLKNRGILIYIDVMKEQEEQNRVSYINNYLDYANQHWNKLDEKEIKAVNDHISNYDFPESVDGNITLAQNAGFKSYEKISHHTWHQAIIFTR